MPSKIPSSMPSDIPSNNPTINPTQIPSNAPTMNPTGNPIGIPSLFPSKNPSNTPTGQPTIFANQSPEPHTNNSDSNNNNGNSNNNETNSWMIVSVIAVSLLVFLIICVVVVGIMIVKNRNVSQRDKIENKTKIIEMPGTHTLNRAKSGTMTRNGQEGAGSITGKNVLSLAQQDSLVTGEIEMEGKGEGVQGDTSTGTYVHAKIATGSNGENQSNLQHINENDIADVDAYVDVDDEKAEAVGQSTSEISNGNDIGLNKKLKGGIGVEDVVMDDIVHHMSTKK